MVEPGKGILPSPPITRLERAHFDAEATDFYGRALRALNEADVPYLIGGALALNHYTGIWRHTKDMDVFARPADVGRVLGALDSAGFETQIVYESWLSKAWEGELFVDVIHRSANALHTVEDVWFEHASPGRLLDEPVRFIPVEELILSKVFVGGRFRFDGADILHVIFAAHEVIDWPHLVARAGEHWQLLLAYLFMYRWTYPGYPDRVPAGVLDELLARVDVERARGPEGARERAFRGTLLDLNSFHVDVAAWGLPDAHAEVIRALGVEH